LAIGSHFPYKSTVSSGLESLPFPLGALGRPRSGASRCSRPRPVEAVAQKVEEILKRLEKNDQRIMTIIARLEDPPHRAPA